MNSTFPLTITAMTQKHFNGNITALCLLIIENASITKSKAQNVKNQRQKMLRYCLWNMNHLHGVYISSSLSNRHHTVNIQPNKWMIYENAFFPVHKKSNDPQIFRCTTSLVGNLKVTQVTFVIFNCKQKRMVNLSCSGVLGDSNLNMCHCLQNLWRR